jgi:hypothetical protein
MSSGSPLGGIMHGHFIIHLSGNCGKSTERNNPVLRKPSRAIHCGEYWPHQAIHRQQKHERQPISPARQLLFPHFTGLLPDGKQFSQNGILLA